MRRAARTDSNHTEIISAFRSLGCAVADTSRLGNGFPDLAVSRLLKTILVEIKDGSLKPSARRLTPDEIRFQREWKGHYVIVESLDDVIVTVRKLLS